MVLAGAILLKIPPCLLRQMTEVEQLNLAILFEMGFVEQVARADVKQIGASAAEGAKQKHDERSLSPHRSAPQPARRRGRSAAPRTVSPLVRAWIDRKKQCRRWCNSGRLRKCKDQLPAFVGGADFS